MPKLYLHVRLMAPWMIHTYKSKWLSNASYLPLQKVVVELVAYAKSLRLH